MIKNSDKTKALFLSSSWEKKTKEFWGAYGVLKVTVELMDKIWELDKHQMMGLWRGKYNVRQQYQVD